MKRRLLFAAAILILVGAVIVIAFYQDQNQAKESQDNPWTPTKDSQSPPEIEAPVGTSEPRSYLVCHEVPVFSDPSLAAEYLVGTAPMGVVQVLEISEEADVVRIQTGDLKLMGWVERGVVSETCF